MLEQLVERFSFDIEAYAIASVFNLLIKLSILIGLGKIGNYKSQFEKL